MPPVATIFPADCHCFFDRVVQWQVRRLFERGLLPPAQRVGAYRVVTAEDLHEVGEALRKAGYLLVGPARVEHNPNPKR